MIEWFSNFNTVEMLFIIGFIGAIVTLPLQDFITLGFYDITDLFIGMVATACFPIIWGNPETVSNTELGIIFTIVSLALIISKIVIILPFRERSENSTTFSMKDIAGRQGVVTTTIPKGSKGEVMVYAGFTRINKSAEIYLKDDPKENVFESIPTGSKILVIEVKDNVLYVLPYVSDIEVTKAKTSWNSN